MGALSISVSSKLSHIGDRHITVGRGSWLHGKTHGSRARPFSGLRFCNRPTQKLAVRRFEVDAIRAMR